MAEKDNIAAGEVKYAWLRRILSDARAPLRNILLVSLFVNLLALAVPVFVLQIYDRVVFHGGITTLYGLIVGIAIVLIFEYVLRQARSRVFQTVAVRVDVVVGRALYDKVMNLPMLTLESRPVAYWQLLFRDMEMVRNALSGPSAALAIDLPFAVIFFIVVFILAPPVAWVLLVVLPIFVILAWRSGVSMDSTAGRERDSTMSRDDFMTELLTGRGTVKALALQGALKPKWENRHADTIELSQERGQVTDSHQVLAHVMMLSTTIMLTTVGALAILEQNMTIGSLIAANMLGSRMVAPMTQLVSQWRMLTQLRQAVTRLDTVFNMESERLDSGIELKRPSGQLRLDKVTFAYKADGAPAVSGIEGLIGPCGLHAIVGRNGSGKSTLLKIIRGLYTPDDGRILIDDADISQFTQSELARWMGYLPQDITLFSGTVRDNISITQPNASDEAIIAAAEKAEVHQFVLEMPDGYSAMVGESGHSLSGGQQQRLALARAFLDNPPIMLLDEPTSNLDNDAEKALAMTLQKTSETTTVIVVTHSAALLTACDSILVMDKGKVVMAGPSSQVLARLQATPQPVNSNDTRTNQA
jgi:ATP-binding cassette subfamily C protein LapB